MHRCVIIPNEKGAYTDGNSFFNLIMVDDGLSIATIHRVIVAPTEKDVANLTGLSKVNNENEFQYEI